MRLTILLLAILSFNSYAEVSADNTKNNDTVSESKDELDNWPRPVFQEATPLDTTIMATEKIIMSTLSPFFTSQNGNKIIVNAQPEALSYVASNGEINAAYLEQALIVLRKEYPDTSDMELAKAIITY